MLKKNEEYIVNIIDNGFQGEGVARIDGVTVFINGAIKNEKVKIKILKVQKSFAYGKILEFLEKSKHRRNSDCATYAKCGGCNLRHVNYEETLKIKKATVENCLYKELKKEIKINETIGMEEPFFYRNKLLYPVGINEKNQSVIGIYSNRSHNIIETNKCNIQNETCQNIANDIFKFVKENDISIYNEKTLKGSLRHIVIRIGIKTNEILVILVLNDNIFKKDKQLIESLTSKYSEIKSIVKNYNTKNTNVILGNKNEIIFGSGYIYDVLGEYKFKISPLSFYQVNPIQTKILYNTAIKYVEDSPPRNLSDIALDLYCGIGTIGIWASKYFNKVYGIEISEDAIKDAKENAKINNIDNIEFYAGDVEIILPKIIEKNNIRPNVVFVDPPRKGLDNKTIETLLNLEAEKIIYISCNPATLARDLNLLQNKYEIKEVQPVDMFPWTSHVECVALLQLKKDI
ncbi:MAG: 23S rRNA (uracil(1939)-C(5))-methyltransferase RlmD [Clostridia bacterium]|nr:23S rRNA (uracil(1939)-C(5))-methyltransferase RlmD [Clostridia bacterium]